MYKHIENLKELRKLTCLDCREKKVSENKIEVSKLDDFRLCGYIISLDFAIEMLEGLIVEFKLKNFLKGRE